MAGETWDMPNQQVVRAAPPSSPKGDGGFDPGDHTVDEVKTHVEANPDQTAAVTKAEESGKARSSLLDWLATQGPTV